MKPSQSLRTLFEITSLAVVVFLTHKILVPAGLALLNADAAVYPITADWIRSGHWAPFQINYSYGGNTLTFLRAFWVGIVEMFSHGPDAYLYGHFSFSYYVAPFLVALSFYSLVRTYASQTSAWIVGLVAALGFHSWIQFLHIEFYSAYLILGCLLLILRKGTENPFMELTLPKLFGVSLLSGVAFYTCRATTIYIVAFFLPLAWTIAEFKSVLQARSRLEKVALRTAVVMASLYGYLELFGGDLGRILGHHVKLHATPNLHIAVLILGVLWFSRRYSEIAWSHLVRGSVVLAGFSIGIIPEFLYWGKAGQLPPLTGGGNYSFQDTFTAVGRIPISLRGIFSATDSATGPVTGTFAANASLILLLLIGITIFQVLRESSKKRAALTPVFFAGFLALFAYVRVMTYDLAPARYLLPVFPVLLIGLALLLDRARGKKFYWVLMGLLLIHCGDQLQARAAFVSKAVNSGDEAATLDLVKRFQTEHLDYVIAQDYWDGNRMTVAAHWKPFFVPLNSTWTLPESVSIAQNTPRVGVMLNAEPRLTDGHMDILGRSRLMIPIGQLRGKFLFIATYTDH